MRIEYRKRSSNGPFIRLYNFSNLEVRKFKQLLKDLADGRIPYIELHKHSEVMDPPENLRLTFYTGAQNKGITMRDDGSYQCILTPVAYSNMIELVASFGLHAIENKSFEWLDESGDVPLLISMDDKWSIDLVTTGNS